MNILFYGFFGIAVIALCFAIYHYNKELGADRPYRFISDIRTWYFRYNLPEHSSSGDSAMLSAANDVANQRKQFFSRVVDNIAPDTSLREDIEQLFILQVLQRYKSESLHSLQWILTYTIFALIAQFVLYFLITAQI
jgi:hypothetical protein